MFQPQIIDLFVIMAGTCDLNLSWKLNNWDLDSKLIFRQKHWMDKRLRCLFVLVVITLYR